MTIRKIQGHLEELYATKVSSELISKVTDGILEEVTVWQDSVIAKVKGTSKLHEKGTREFGVT